MNIVGYKLYETTVHCRRPFKIASGLQDECRTLILELVSRSGARSHGEAVPIPLLTQETYDGCRQTLIELLLPLLRDHDVWSLKDLHRAMAKVTDSRSARCAVDLAVHGLQARLAGVSLSRLLGSGATKFATNYSIGIETLETTLELAQELVGLGYDRLKLKVGLEVERDIETVRGVSEILPPGVMLRLDANGGWDRLSAVKVLRALERGACPIELVEQPTPRDDFHGLRFVKERTEFPIAADESVRNLGDARQLLEAGSVDILNLKLMKSGGILPVAEIANLGRAYGARLMIGGMVGESFLGVGAAAAVAAALNFEYADLDADILLKDSPFTEEHFGGDSPLRCEPPYRQWSAGPLPEVPTLQDGAILVEEWTSTL